MKYFFTFLIALISAMNLGAQPCSTTNGTNCFCPDSAALHCELLPDLVVTRDILLEADLNPEIKGELRLSVATPNIGYGPLEVHASNYFICGTDTIFEPDGMLTCPDGTYPRQLVQQTVYNKNNEDIFPTVLWAGSMTYHPTHGHMHVDEWCSFSLRLPIEGETDPMNWIIIAEGAKLGFCLMDYGSCNLYDGYCRNADDEVLNSTNIPNYNMGGGGYDCGLNQGISAGWTDIYHHYLDDMDIPIDPEVCDGDYYLVVEVDPNNNFRETKEDNNIMVVPFTLAQQNPKPESVISAKGNVTICKGDTYQVAALLGSEFIWNSGETTASIDLQQAGDYFVTVVTPCEAIPSDTLHLIVLDADVTNVQNDTLCTTGSATLSTTANGEIAWYDAPTEGNLVGTGDTLTTPEIAETTTYYVEQTQLFGGYIQYNEPHDNTFGNGGTNSSQFNGGLIFDAHQPFTLKSVKVYLPPSGEEKEHIILLINSTNDTIQQRTVFIPLGENRITLDFEVEQGIGYRLISAQHPGLWRTNTDVTYPYELEGIVSITGSNYDNPDQGNYYYYYYYDWEIKEADYLCQSTMRTPVTAVVMNCVGIDEVTTQPLVNVTPNPNAGSFTLQVALPAATSALGTKLSLIDMKGKIIWQQTVHTSGTYPVLIDNNKIPSGIYLLQINNNEQRFVQKVVVCN